MTIAVVLNYNDHENCINLIGSLKNFVCVDRIVVVDNRSPDGSYEKLTSLADEKTDVVQSDRNGGYSYGNNYGARIALERYNADKLIFLNTDVIIGEETLSASLEVVGKDNIAYCAPLMQYSYKDAPEPISRADKNWFTALMKKTVIGTFIRKLVKAKPHPKGVHDVTLTCGAVCCISARAFVEAGMFDENVFLYYEENILFYKLKKLGYRITIDGDHKYIHAHGASINKAIKGKYKKFVEGAKSEKYFWFEVVKINAFSKFLYRIIAAIIRFERFIGYSLTGR